MSDLDDAMRTRIERACERLSIAYANHVDARRYDAFVELFADDAHLNAGGALDGKAAIRRAMARRSDRLRSRHVLTNILIEALDAEHARGVTYLSLYRHVGDESLGVQPVDGFQPAAIGQYDDEFVLTSDGWRFARRELSLAFRNPSAFPAG
jgi:3-phenylpropionate/cinnamic acid dioxygenase small subunit